MDFDKLVVGFLVDEVVGGFFISVPPGHIACVYDRGWGVLDKTWGPGLHLKIPFWQIAKLFNAQILEYNINNHFEETNKEALGSKAINAVTKDGTSVEIEGSILFKIDRRKAPQVWENIGENFVSKVIRPVSSSKIHSVISEITYDQLTAYRSQVEQRVKNELMSSFEDKGIICEGFLLSEVRKHVTKTESASSSPANSEK
jgi:regulator of protease activity HflC (stomatin/prohibitin superfamily)